MINYFIGISEEQLETWLADAQAALAAGRTTIIVSAGDSSATERVEVDIWKRIEQLLYALNLLNPTDYPTAQCRRVTRTRLQVWPWNYPFANA